jgi:hypothetical protein
MIRARLDAELTEAAIQRLDACSRLDLQLWRRIGAMRMDPAELERLRGRTLLTTAAHHAALLGGG